MSLKSTKPHELIVQSRKNNLQRSWRRESVRIPVVRLFNFSASKCRLFSTLESSPSALQLSVFHLHWDSVSALNPSGNGELGVFMESRTFFNNLWLRPPRILLADANAEAIQEPVTTRLCPTHRMTSPPTAPWAGSSQHGTLCPKRRLQYRRGENLQAPHLQNAEGSHAETTHLAEHEKRSLQAADPSQPRCPSRAWLPPTSGTMVTVSRTPERSSRSSQQ